MKRIKTYKIFESSSEDMDEIREVFTDSDFEEKNIDIVYNVEPDGVQVSLNKNYLIPDAARSSLSNLKSNLERLRMTKAEYLEIHDLIMSKVTYLHDVDIKCVNVVYCMMDDKYEKTYKSLTDYFSENVDMSEFLNFLYAPDKKNHEPIRIVMIMLYFRFR
jgi:hypothetical protein